MFQSQGKTAIIHTLYAILLPVCLVGCLNLKPVSEYSTNALDGIKKLDQVGFGFAQYCLEKCQLEAIDSFKIYRSVPCSCGDYKRADSVVNILYHSVSDYFEGLSRLSKNELTSFQLDAVKKALKEEDLKIIQIRKADVDAWTKIGDILLRTVTDTYRLKQIKAYIVSANPSLQVVISKLEFVESKNLGELLNFKRERLFDHYRALLKIRGMSDYERQKATEDYYHALQEVEDVKNQLLIYSKSLKTIARGHQALAENANKISSSDVKRSLLSYAAEIQDLIAAFNKIRSK
jgi:hypothetical protein